MASLPELMKQVPLINTKLKRYVKPEKFKKKAKDTAGYTAVIAAIAQGSMADTSETKKPEQVKQWYGFSAAMRDDAGAVNAAIHQGDEPAAAKAMKKLHQSCEDCHAVFHPGVKNKQEDKAFKRCRLTAMFGIAPGGNNCTPPALPRPRGRKGNAMSERGRFLLLAVWLGMFAAAAFFRRASCAAAARCDSPALSARHGPAVAIDFVRESHGRRAREARRPASGLGRKGLPPQRHQAGRNRPALRHRGPRHDPPHLGDHRSESPDQLRAWCFAHGGTIRSTPASSARWATSSASAQGKIMPYCSAVHSVGSEAGMNIWLPMPFLKRAKFTFTNESSKPCRLLLPDHLHAGRQAPRRTWAGCTSSSAARTPPREEGFRAAARTKTEGALHRLCHRRPQPPSRAVVGRRRIQSLHGRRHGVSHHLRHRQRRLRGLSWGVQQTPFLYNGCSLNEENFVSMYRWHLADPIAWQQKCRITIQQISLREEGAWRRPRTTGRAPRSGTSRCPAPLPPMPDVKARTADIWPEEPDKEVVTTAIRAEGDWVYAVATLAERPGIADFRRFLLCASVK